MSGNQVDFPLGSRAALAGQTICPLLARPFPFGNSIAGKTTVCDQIIQRLHGASRFLPPRLSCCRLLALAGRGAAEAVQACPLPAPHGCACLIGGPACC